MDFIKKIPEEDISTFTDIVMNAYPGEDVSEDDRQRIIESLTKMQRESSDTSLYGLYRDNQLVGGMRLHDFPMTIFSTRIATGGVGLVAVHLTHKKEKICKEMISFYLRYYKNRGAYLALLYPFSSSFYRKMGFGYGTKMNHYSFKPDELPRGKSKKNICFLGKDDAKALADCYNRYADQTHGLIQRSEKSRNILGYLTTPKIKVVGYKKNTEIFGFLVFKFVSAKKDNFILNDMILLEFIYETPDAFLELSTFLHTQADQIRRIIYDTQDENFHYLLKDPRNGSNNIFSTSQETNAQGIGIMYRVIDIKGFFDVLKDHNFGNQTCILRVTIADSFLPENHGSTTIHFENGMSKVKGSGDLEYNVEISLEISDFSSLVMGIISFKDLLRYNLVKISDQSYVDTVNRLFLTERKPICLTQF